MRSIWAIVLFLVSIVATHLHAQTAAPKYEMFYFTAGGYGASLQIVNPSSQLFDLPGLGRVEPYQTLTLHGWPGKCVNGQLNGDPAIPCGGTKVLSIPVPLVPRAIMTDDTGSSIEVPPLVRFKGEDVQVQALDTVTPNHSIVFTSSDVFLDFFHDTKTIAEGVTPTLCTGDYCFVNVPKDANRVVIHPLSIGWAGSDGSFLAGGIVFDGHGAQIWREPTEMPKAMSVPTMVIGLGIGVGVDYGFWNELTAKLAGYTEEDANPFTLLAIGLACSHDTSAECRKMKYDAMYKYSRVNGFGPIDSWRIARAWRDDKPLPESIAKRIGMDDEPKATWDCTESRPKIDSGSHSYDACVPITVGKKE